MKSAAIALCGVLVLFASTARADILHLEGGGRIEGVVTGGPEVFTVRSLAGTARIPADEIVRRVETPYVTETYERKLARTDRTDPDALYLLSIWCERKGLSRRARALLDEILLLDPDHAKTRARLGQVRFEGNWMTEAEARDARMVKEGFVKYEGRWFTPDGLKAYIRAKQETARLEEEIARKRALREEKERKRREAEEKKKREEALLRQVEEDRRERERLQRERDQLVDLLRALHLRDAWSGRYAGWRTGYYPYGVGYGYCRPRPVPYGYGRGHPAWSGSGSFPRTTFPYTQGRLTINRVSRPVRER
jgi:hypothetical protein